MTATLALAVATGSLFAAEPQDKMVDFVTKKTAEWLQSDSAIAAITAQNARTAGLSAGAIDTLDKEWRAQVGQLDTPLINSVVNSELSMSLIGHVDASGGMVTELIVMDAQGLNVALSSVTSDYWQGDEEKHQQTYGVGPGAIHIGEIELDESTQTYQAQVSLSLIDPATDTVIGAVTFGLNAEAFF
ncbi:hypothetical protein [Pseudosulfitobacter koreensis]|uniref:Uncharacterized protein n=1 Tax=Pseudosulfitobacter koreensis TaxID=2968472 RepID=A0ABT1Z0G0_9RHOB|nr:hypothetical protein [Pseudosulfitobacter koreense]MCR8826597.1 hypothetical protein [Pseudosulfitobacter koreense]